MILSVLIEALNLKRSVKSGFLTFYETIKIDALVKSFLINAGWLSRKFHIQGAAVFQGRGNTCSMPSV